MANNQLKDIIESLFSLENLQQDRLLFYNLTQDMTIPVDLLLCLEPIAILNPSSRDLIEAAKDTMLDYVKESHSFALNLTVPRRRLIILDER
jgi:hypothetical protein